MKIAFLTNFFNHHQKNLAAALYRTEGVDFRLVATETIPEERLKLGYQVQNEEPYLLDYGKEAEDFLDTAEVIIAGSAPEQMIQRQLKKGKLILRYHERPLKKGMEPLKFLPRWYRWHKRNPRNANVYLLAASAFAAADYAKFGLFSRKAFKWGYFPETKEYDDFTQMLCQKEPNSILWAGRFLPEKHPEDAVLAAEILKRKGYRFHLTLIGTGEQEQKIKNLVKEKQLEDIVCLPGAMSPEQVRMYMERAQIYLFTSDKQEGWGAVLNESMNSGCAVVASHEIGAVPFLIEDDRNGMIYRSCNVQELSEKIEELLQDPDKCRRLGQAAYETLLQTWNAETAAERLVQVCRKLLRGESAEGLYQTGPCSPAEKIGEDWYSHEIQHI